MAAEIESHRPVVSSDPSDEWCAVCDEHLNVCEMEVKA